MIKIKPISNRMRRFALALVALAGLAAAVPAIADPLYETDRAYCMCGESTEPRALCLKEAAAALAERQRSTHGDLQLSTARRSVKHSGGASQPNSASVDKGVATAST